MAEVYKLAIRGMRQAETDMVWRARVAVHRTSSMKLSNTSLVLEERALLMIL